MRKCIAIACLLLLFSGTHVFAREGSLAAQGTGHGFGLAKFRIIEMRTWDEITNEFRCEHIADLTQRLGRTPTRH
jgi:hypothetical protein